MKKIFYLGLILWGSLLSFSSCSSSSSDQSVFAVVKSDVKFTPKASVGSIIVRSTNGFTATANTDWCKVSAADSTVTVNVTANTAKESRNAIVTLTDGISTLHVPVAQQGSVWYVKGSATHLLNDADTTFTITAKIDYTYQVKKPSWITGEVAADGYSIHVAKNSTGKGRVGHVILYCASDTTDVPVVQFGAEDIAGTYQAKYTTKDEDKDVSAVDTFTISKGTSANAFIAEGLSSLKGLNIPLVFNPNDGSLTVKNAQYLGAITSKNYYFYTIMATKAGYLLNSSSYTYGATPTFSLSEEVIMPIYTFTGADVTLTTSDGNVSTTINGFTTYVFSKRSTSFTYKVGFWDYFQDLMITRIQ